jgi:hypothetical protein
LKQVRAAVTSLDRYRRREVLRQDRDRWTMVIQGWLAWKLAHSTRLTRSSTAVQWLIAVQGRVPYVFRRGEVASLIRGIASLNLLRPAARLWDVGDLYKDARLAARSKASRSRTDLMVWIAVTLMGSASALRLADAVRVAAGGAAATWLSDKELVVYPIVEKTDQVGSREVEPVYVPCVNDSDARMFRRWLRQIRQQDDATGDHQQIEEQVTSVLHTHGIQDVRALRRDAGRKVGARKAAALLLRHKPDSKSTTRYTGTDDRITLLRRLAT